MSRGAAHLVSKTWSGQATREVYSDFNDLTLQIVTDALFGFRASTPDSQNVTGTAQDFQLSKSQTSACGTPNSVPCRCGAGGHELLCKQGSNRLCHPRVAANSQQSAVQRCSVPTGQSCVPHHCTAKGTAGKRWRIRKPQGEQQYEGMANQQSPSKITESTST